ncbi:TetR/AcrR family transcriptional regulator [Actinomadura sp. 6N118]|uniref:TetR/AcrR family transcriptional regulator n=1 Tax=Actinomadura sp. 6N118 TaxID=3375151 RepID=UPI00378C0F5F
MARMSAERRRDQILDATRAIVDAEGFAAVTIGRVAEAAGITRTLVYHQFQGLSGLLTALVDREAERAMAGLIKVITQRPSGDRDPFTAALAGLIEAASADPATWRMFLMPSEGGPPELYERIEQGRAVGRARIIELVKGADDGNAVPTGPDPELTIHLLHMVGDELLRLHLRDPDTYPAERVLAQCEHMASYLHAVV